MAGSVVARIGGALLALILLVVAALLFLGIYLVVPVHYVALLWIGALALVFSVVSYFAQAITSNPIVQRACAWGFMAMGFVVLFLTVLFPPAGAINPIVQLIGVIILLLLAIVWIAVIGWSARTKASTDSRERARKAWSSQPPPSAFAYSTAQLPGTTPPASGAASTPPPSPPVGGG